jgi:hypothetical protein
MSNKQEMAVEIYNIGDVCIMINPNEDDPKVFKTHKVDNDFGVVYYFKLNGVEETIGFSYIKKHTEVTNETIHRI